MVLLPGYEIGKSVHAGVVGHQSSFVRARRVRNREDGIVSVEYADAKCSRILCIVPCVQRIANIECINYHQTTVALQYGARHKRIQLTASQCFSVLRPTQFVHDRRSDTKTCWGAANG